MAAGYASSVNYSDNDVMTAVGFLEGALTQQSVLDTHLQLFSDSNYIIVGSSSVYTCGAMIMW